MVSKTRLRTRSKLTIAEVVPDGDIGIAWGTGGFLGRLALPSRLSSSSGRWNGREPKLYILGSGAKSVHLRWVGITLTILGMGKAKDCLHPGDIFACLRFLDWDVDDLYSNKLQLLLQSQSVASAHSWVENVQSKRFKEYAMSDINIEQDATSCRTGALVVAPQ